MHLRVKICGVTTPADALQAAELGADAIGLNFYPPSPRCVSAQAAIRIRAVLPPFVTAVGVYVNRPAAGALAHAQELGLAALQCHGDTPELPPAAPCSFIPAFALRDRADLLSLQRYLQQCHALGRLPAAVLVDARVPGQYGGTGQTLPWELLAGYRPAVPLILAGGLTPANVAEAVRIVRPQAVDVASGVESAPGRKDAAKVGRFIEQARAAAS